MSTQTAPHSPAKGCLFVLSAPSGGGKTSLVQALTRKMTGITVSISHTTREKRPAEQQDINYHFVSRDTFQDMIHQQQFLEYATIFGNLYGTSREGVEKTLKMGTDVILEIDWQGCENIQRLFPDCISIFITPPSPAILKNRLTERAQDKPEIITERLADAQEMFKHINRYDYIVLNDQFEQALSDLMTIVSACRLKRERQQITLHTLLAAFKS